MRILLVVVNLIFIVILSFSSVHAAGSLVVRIEQTSNDVRIISILNGVDRGKRVVPHMQTVQCSDPSLIIQRLDLARALDLTKEVAVFQTAQNDISSGKVNAKGQCESFTHRYGIVDLTQYNAGHSLFVETPHGSFIGKIIINSGRKSFNLSLEDGSIYTKGLSGNREDDMYALGDMLHEEEDMLFPQMNASLY